MKLNRKLARILSMVLTFCMLFGGPLSVSEAQAFPGVSTLAVGTGAGGVAALGVGALVGSLGLAAAPVGLPAIALIGAVVGGLTTAIVGNRDSSKSASGVGMGAAAAGLSAAALGAGGLLFSPWVLIPAAAVGIGALIWKYAKEDNRYGGAHDTRFRGPFSTGFTNPNLRIANRSSTGDMSELSVLDRVRNVFDRNRRDDNFYAGSVVMPDGTLRQRSDFFGRMGTFFNGRTDTGTFGGNLRQYGPGYGQPFFSPLAQPATDRLGRITSSNPGSLTGFASADAGSAIDGLGGLSPNSPTSGDVGGLEDEKASAYQALVEQLKAGDDPTAVSDALDAYRAAARELAVQQAGASK